MKKLNLAKIDRLRIGLGWSRNQLAREAGVTQGTISHLFSRPKQSPSLKTACGIAMALEVDLMEILEDDEEEQAAA